MRISSKGLGVWGLLSVVLCSSVSCITTVAEVPAPPVTAGTSAATAKRPLNVLFIGNSYTFYNGGLGSIVQCMATKDGHRMQFTEVTKGGQTLEGHWKDGKALAQIRKGGWDVVVLQEHSTRPLTAPEKMQEFARLFHAEIRKVGARTVFYETWARKNKPETQVGLCAAYETLARELGAAVAPAGRAWEAALRAQPALKLHVADMSHPTPAGSYLNACVMYSALFGGAPQDMPRAVRSVTGKSLFELAEPEAAMLQKAARDVLFGFARAQATPGVGPAIAPGAANAPAAVAPAAASAVAAEKRS
ncbi:MAG: SGNH/GDSL hydrolase family protein [Phycisphaerae bacterium]|nr:hypothetical protein [Tepidisphaeraceae bacterium]